MAVPSLAGHSQCARAWRRLMASVASASLHHDDDRSSLEPCTSYTTSGRNILSRWKGCSRLCLTSSESSSWPS